MWKSFTSAKVCSQQINLVCSQHVETALHPAHHEPTPYIIITFLLIVMRLLLTKKCKANLIKEIALHNDKAIRNSIDFGNT